MNARIQKFSSDGTYVSSFGKSGPDEGELKEPNGVAVDATGNIYVTDALNHKLLKYDPDGTFIKEWKEGQGTFYGPRDIVIAPNKQIYFIDQGHTRLVRFDPVTEVFIAWGTDGSGEGQFNESTGITATDNGIVVSDTGNNRIEIFDFDGKFIRQWPVPPEIKSTMNFPDPVYDSKSKHLFVSSGKANEILEYDLEGQQFNGYKAGGEVALDNPSSLAIFDEGKTRYLLVLNTGSDKVVKLELDPKAGLKPAQKKADDKDKEKDKDQDKDKDKEKKG